MCPACPCLGLRKQPRSGDPARSAGDLHHPPAAGRSRERGHQRVPQVRLRGVGGVDAEPVDQAVVPLVHQPAQVLRCADDGEGREHLVVDQIAHRRPLVLAPADRQRVQLLAEGLPAVQLQDRPVGRRAAVERDGRLDGLRSAGHPLLRATGHHQARQADGDGAPRPAGGRQPLVQGRERPLAQVARGGEAVDQQAVGDLPDEPGHRRADGRQVHRRRPPLVGGRGEHRRHQRVPVVLALEAQRDAVLPGAPDRVQRADVLAHPRDRLAPRHREPPLDVGLDLRAQAQHEPAARVALQVVRAERQRHRRAGESDCDGRADRHPLRRRPGGVQEQERVVVDLRCPDARVAARLQVAGGGGHVIDPGGQQRGVEEHGSPACRTGPALTSAGPVRPLRRRLWPGPQPWWAAGVSDLGAELRTAARDCPDRVFLVGDGDPVTFADLDARADRCAAGLTARGIVPGDRVAVAGLNTVDWLTLFFGAPRLGAAVVTLNVRYRETELGYMLGHSGARMVVTPADVGGFDYPAMYAALRPRLPALEAVVWFGDDGPDGFAGLLPTSGPPPEDRLEPGTPAVVLYTSGTTGRPKGAVLTHSSLLASARGQQERQSTGPDDVLVATLPFNHVGGLTCTVLHSLVSRARVALIPAFSPSAALAAGARPGGP